MSRKFSNSPCRNCGHYHSRSISFIEEGQVLSCVHYPPFELANCMCDYKDFVPSDNLEFLEYVYDKQNSL